MAELGRWCGRCGTELRSGARFCSKCGQRVIGEEPLSAPQVTPAQPQDDWVDWFMDPSPRVPELPPANQPPAISPPAYQEPAAPPPFPFFAPQAGGSDSPQEWDRRSRAPLFWSVLSAAVVAAAVLILLLLHPFGHHKPINNAANSTGTTPARSAASTAAASAAAASLSATAVTERRAAATVAGMLAGSVADRTAIDSAFGDVDSCGPNLNGDAAVFTRAASSRRAMLASLAALPGRSALPPALVSDLANAWQASSAADQDYATWATDEVTKGCVHDDTSDPAYRATSTPDNAANEYKTAFVAQWNPIAARYDLTTYQQNQL